MSVSGANNGGSSGGAGGIDTAGAQQDFVNSVNDSIKAESEFAKLQAKASQANTAAKARPDQ